jgi:hypothetical protein
MPTRRRPTRVFTHYALAACLLLACCAHARATEFGIQGSRFTLDGKPAFLLGCSYYAGLGASDQTLRSDLDELKRHGFNWVRVWATWAAFDHDVSAVDGASGAPRPAYVERLKHLVDECDRRGMVVDVTLSRGNGATGPAKLQGLEAHRRAVQTVLDAIGGKKNWYLDLSNERNIRDGRFTSVEDLAALRQFVGERDPRRQVTASHAGDASRDDVTDYLKTARLDFLSIHRPRDRNSPGQTAEKTRLVLKWSAEVGGADGPVPVHYDEPLRRGWSDWQPSADDFRADLQAARDSGAAGWCFHNGATRGATGGATKGAADGRPRRSFDLSDRTLLEQLDHEERTFVGGLQPLNN